MKSLLVVAQFYEAYAKSPRTPSEQASDQGFCEALPEFCISLYDAYSKRLPVEFEGDDCGDCLSERFVGAAVVGVEYSPGLEVCDSAFDLERYS